MGVVIKKGVTIPYKTIILKFGDAGASIAPIVLYNDTNVDFDYYAVAGGFISIGTTGDPWFDPNNTVVSISQQNDDYSPKIINMITDTTSIKQIIQFQGFDIVNQTTTDKPFVFSSITILIFE